MAPALVFIHSPLVGPSPWMPSAATARGRGHRAMVPDATSFAADDEPAWDGFVALASADLDEQAGSKALIVHSGAGALAPSIADRVPTIESIVFVDAVLPPAEGPFTTPDEFRSFLDDQSTGGILAPWPDWWAEEVMTAILPDAADRTRLRADAPSLPRSLYDQPIPIPDAWTRTHRSFLQLSAAYGDEYADAMARGWAAERLDGTHLWPMTNPDAVVAAIERLLGIAPQEVTPPGGRVS